MCLGLCVMAFGVAFSIKAALGTSPISSVPAVTANISGLSVGTTTIIMNFLFVLLQIMILRRRYEWFQLLQLPAAIVFGLIIDGASVLLRDIQLNSYLLQWCFCALGIFLVALGVSIEVTAGLVTTAGEGLVLAVCQAAPVSFGNMKVFLDVSLVCIAVLLSFLFLGHLESVREGTAAAAVCVGLISKQTSKLTNKLGPAFLA